jgi:hypothetical protein
MKNFIGAIGIFIFFIIVHIPLIACVLAFVGIIFYPFFMIHYNGKAECGSLNEPIKKKK